jgi:hypothetical protein
MQHEALAPIEPALSRVQTTDLRASEVDHQGSGEEVANHESIRRENELVVRWLPADQAPDGRDCHEER